jgi:serralysin
MTNSGFIKGDVLMGAEEDSYTASGSGVVHGGVYGGLGADTLTGAKAGDTIYGDDGSNSGQDGDDLISGGKGNDKLFGNGGNDTITGGVGADQLDGGPGADRFVYLSVKDSTAAHADTIAGLVGNDHIDLSAIDADVSTKGVNDAFTLVSSFDGHAGELVVSYDSGADRTLVQGDVDGDGAADLVIYITGDQTAFTGYVL